MTFRMAFCQVWLLLSLLSVFHELIIRFRRGAHRSPESGFSSSAPGIHVTLKIRFLLWLFVSPPSTYGKLSMWHCFVLKWLDGKEIERSERIQALQDYHQVQQQIKEQEEAYLLKRARERQDVQSKSSTQQIAGKEVPGRNPGFDGRWYTDINNTLYVQQVLSCFTLLLTKTEGEITPLPHLTLKREEGRVQRST